MPSMYKKYGKVVSPMGCRAFLSPWYERGGMEPADENDNPVFVGRFNIGAVSLHLPMILAKSRQENRDFYEVLDYYLEMIRGLHKRTYEYIGELRASVNPVMCCEGGFYGGHLQPHDKMKKLLKPMTASFGITALNELQQLYNHKSLREDGQFALEVMEYINNKVNQYKKEDGWLYALYGTPAESLCLAGDTEVQTYEGYKKIKDITESDLVYSFNENKHKVELKRVLSSKQTQSNAKVLKVIFKNRDEIVCTPNHPFAVRFTKYNKNTHRITGEEINWINASNLKPGFRVKSNYIRLNSNGRPECSNYYNGNKQLIQDINAEYIYGPKPANFVTHHTDRNKENNFFENLQYMSDPDHRREHLSDTIEKYQYKSEDVMGEKNPFYGKHHTDESKLLNRNAHMGNPIAQYTEDGRLVNIYECLEDAKRDGFVDNIIRQCCKGLRNVSETIKSNNWYRGYLWGYYFEPIETNHIVESVEWLDDPIDVYNIEVEDNHNFFVGGANGILVHNCSLQVEQFRKMYGIIENVSDKPYVSNSFHCHVSEDISPIEKQDKEERFWNLMNGGKIQYVRYPINYNIEAIRTLVRRAMKKGFYEGVNLSLAYCEDCGHEELEMDVCPKCGSRNLTKIDRMNG